MGEGGKRSRPQRDYDEEGRYQKRRLHDKDERGNGELVIYRILCPSELIGSVIGKSGKVINSIRQETRAKVKVIDPFPGAKDRVIMVYCYVRDKEEVEVDEEFDEKEPLCAAQDALLRLHVAIANAVASASDYNKRQNVKEECQILVPSSQSANVIGKAGATIKKLRSRTRAFIKISAKDASDPTHSCAMDFDNFVLISGEPEGVKKALYAVSAIMYKFSPREEIPVETTVSDAPPSIIIPSDLSIYPPGGLYTNADPILPPRTIPPILGTMPVPDLQRYADRGSGLPVYSSTLPLVPGFSASSQAEDLVLRVLCPFSKIGRVIGKGGATIRSIRQASGAHIEVDDTKSDPDECVITITATESPDDLKSMAVEAVLLLQGKINDEDDDMVKMRLLVQSKVIGYIIGKSGSIINEIRKRTKADVQISKGDKPKCADAGDELIEIGGDVASVRDALIQIVLRLRDDALKDKDGGRNSSLVAETLYPGASALPLPSLLPSIPSVASLGYGQRTETESGLGMLSSSRLFGYGNLPIRENGYESTLSLSSKLYGGLPPSSTLEIVVPAYAVGKVLGKGGMNLANIRKISGAMVEISESKTSRGDRVALVSGTSEQKQAAENLIQAFIMST